MYPHDSWKKRTNHDNEQTRKLSYFSAKSLSESQTVSENSSEEKQYNGYRYIQPLSFFEYFNDPVSKYASILVQPIYNFGWLPPGRQVQQKPVKDE